MKNKKLVASVAAIMLLATGTFAWQSFSQLATNEIVEKVDPPGARLHDYFNGKDKDVFVENYAPGNYAPDVYARIRLSEYFEYGKQAGSLDVSSSTMTVVRGDIQQEGVPSISNTDTWDVYNFGSEAEEGTESIRTYRDLDLGGSTVYMPTFNRDNTNLEPEVKGTYRDENGDVKADPYDDYKSYDKDDTESAKVVTQEGEADTESIHLAKETAEATIMSMEAWKLLSEEEQIGDFWVFDTTGWAYYARPIVGSTATGLLLDEIAIESNPSEEWYYAIDVTAQIATKGDWGDEPSGEDTGDGTGMYEDLTDDAKDLLDKVSGAGGTVAPETQPAVTKIEILGEDRLELEPEDLVIKVGESNSYQVDLTIENGTGASTEEEVKWSIVEVSSASKNSSVPSEQTLGDTLEEGRFTPVSAMAGNEYDITATSVLTPRTNQTIRVFVYDDSLALEILEKDSLTDVKVETSHELTPCYVGSTTKVPVTWSVVEVSGNSELDSDELNDTMSESGVFTPAAAMARGVYTITATTKTLPTLTAEITLNVYAGDGSKGDGTGGEDSTVTVTVSSTEDELSIGSNLIPSAEVTGLINDSVRWEIAKESGTSSLTPEDVSATINADTGVFTPVVGMSGCTYTIKAISTVDEVFWGSKDISVLSGSVTVTSDDDSMTLSNTEYTMDLSADVTGLTDQSVTWTIRESGTETDLSGIMSTSGLLTATDAMAGKTYKVTATSTIDTGASGYKYITIAAPTVEVTVSGDATTVDKGTTVTFEAVTTGLRSPSVTWERSGHADDDTTINSTSGVLTVAGTETSAKVITATATVKPSTSSHVTTANTETGENTVTVTTPTLEVKSADDAVTVNQGNTLKFSADIENLPEDTVTWSITTTGHNSGTSIDDDGLLTIGAAETVNRSITVEAKSTVDTNLKGTKSVVVQSYTPSNIPGYSQEEILNMVGTTETLTVNGTEFYVIGEGTFDGRTAVKLLVKTSTGTSSKFNNSLSDGNAYSGSVLRTAVTTWYNSWLSAGAISASDVVTSSPTTRSTGSPSITTSDAAFILSSDEASALSSTIRTTGSISWLRTSVSSNSNYAYLVTSSGVVTYGHYVTDAYAVRPALWIYL